jgi:stage V sporulation protein G
MDLCAAKSHSIIFLIFLLRELAFGRISFSIKPQRLRTRRERGTEMDITDVRVRTIGDEGKLRAIVSVTFDDEFVVHDIKVIEGQNGLFIAMPSRKMNEGDFRDIAHPLSSETRNRIKSAIFEKYESVLGTGNMNAGDLAGELSYQ